MPTATKYEKGPFLSTSFPPLLCRLPGDLSAPFWGEGLRACLPAPLPQALGSLVLAVVGGEVLGLLARGDLHHLDGGADHVGGALLALWSFRHALFLTLLA